MSINGGKASEDNNSNNLVGKENVIGNSNRGHDLESMLNCNGYEKECTNIINSNNKLLQSSIHVLRQNNRVLDFATYVEMVQMVTNKRIESIKALFKDELQQVDVLIALISKFMDFGFKLGMTFEDIVKGLEDYDKFYLFENEPYVLNLLKLMSCPNIALLDYTEVNRLYNTNSFSYSYYNHVSSDSNNFFPVYQV